MFSLLSNLVSETRSSEPATTSTTAQIRPESLKVVAAKNVSLIATPMGDSSVSPNKVGQSVFYDCIDASPMCEKQDVEGREKSDTENEDSKNTNVFPMWFILISFPQFQIFTKNVQFFLVSHTLAVLE